MNEIIRPEDHSGTKADAAGVPYDLIELSFLPIGILSAIPTGFWRLTASAAPITACCISSTAAPA